MLYLCIIANDMVLAVMGAMLPPIPPSDAT